VLLADGQNEAISFWQNLLEPKLLMKGFNMRLLIKGGKQI
jgi:hypothetical protein